MVKLSTNLDLNKSAKHAKSNLKKPINFPHCTLNEFVNKNLFFVEAVITSIN